MNCHVINTDTTWTLCWIISRKLTFKFIIWGPLKIILGTLLCVSLIWSIYGHTLSVSCGLWCGHDDVRHQIHTDYTTFLYRKWFWSIPGEASRCDIMARVCGEKRERAGTYWMVLEKSPSSPAGWIPQIGLEWRNSMKKNFDLVWHMGCGWRLHLKVQVKQQKT